MKNKEILLYANLICKFLYLVIYIQLNIRIINQLFYLESNINKLKGLAHLLNKRMRIIHIETYKDLLNSDTQVLQKEFGSKLCRILI